MTDIFGTWTAADELLVHGSVWSLWNLNMKLALLRSSILKKKNHEVIQYQSQQFPTEYPNKRPSILLEILRGQGRRNRDSFMLLKILIIYENHKGRWGHIFARVFWQYYLLAGLEDHKLSWWRCSACETVALPVDIVDATDSLGKLLSAYFTESFQSLVLSAPLPQRAAQTSGVPPFVSCVCTEIQGLFWCGWGTALPEAAVQSAGAFVKVH